MEECQRGVITRTQSSEMADHVHGSIDEKEERTAVDRNFDYSSILPTDAEDIRELTDIFDSYISDDTVGEKDVIEELKWSAVQLLQCFAHERKANQKVNELYGIALDKNIRKLDQLRTRLTDGKVAKDSKSSSTVAKQEQLPSTARKPSSNSVAPSAQAVAVSKIKQLQGSIEALGNILDHGL